MSDKIKSVLAVLAGFVTITALSLGVDMILRTLLPQRFTPEGGAKEIGIPIIALFYSAGFGVFGCYVAARFAPRKPKRHAIILGFIGLAIAILATIGNWRTAPAWYHVVALVLILPAAWIGGEIRERQMEK